MFKHLRYEIYPEVRHLPEIGSYTAYGLRCLCLSGAATQQRISELGRNPDVTTDRGFAENLAFRFERGQADPLHMQAILEDIL